MFADSDYDQSASIIAELSKRLKEFRNQFQRIMEHGTPDDFIRSVFNNNWNSKFGYENYCDYKGAFDNIFTATSPVTHANKRILYIRAAYYLNQIIEAFENLGELKSEAKRRANSDNFELNLCSYDIEDFSAKFIGSAKAFLTLLEKEEENTDLDVNINLVIQHKDFSFIRKNDEEEKLFTSLYYSKYYLRRESLLPKNLSENIKNFINICNKNTYIWAYRGFFYQMLTYNISKTNIPVFENREKVTKNKNILINTYPPIAYDFQPKEDEKDLRYGLKNETLKAFKKCFESGSNLKACKKTLENEFEINRATLWWALKEIVSWELGNFKKMNGLDSKCESLLFEFPNLNIQIPKDISLNDRLLYVLIELLIFDYSSNELDNILMVSKNSSTPEIYIGFRTSCYVVLNALDIYKLLSKSKRIDEFTNSISKLEKFIEDNLIEIVDYWRKNQYENLYLMSLFLKVLTKYLLNYQSRRDRLKADVKHYLKNKSRIEIDKSKHLLIGSYAKPTNYWDNPTEDIPEDSFSKSVNTTVENICRYIKLSKKDEGGSKREIRPYNVFICGAPGTGKTYLAKQLINTIKSGLKEYKEDFQTTKLNLSSDLASKEVNKSHQEMDTSKINFFIIDETDAEHINWNQFGYFLEPMWETKIKKGNINVDKGILVNFFIGSKFSDIKTFENEMFNRNNPIKSKDFNSRLFDKIEIPATTDYRDRIINGCIVIKNYFFKDIDSLELKIGRKLLEKIGIDESSDFKRNIEKECNILSLEKEDDGGYFISGGEIQNTKKDFIKVGYKYDHH